MNRRSFLARERVSGVLAVAANMQIAWQVLIGQLAPWEPDSRQASPNPVETRPGSAWM
jgi:hypothetical protein